MYRWLIAVRETMAEPPQRILSSYILMMFSVYEYWNTSHISYLFLILYLYRSKFGAVFKAIDEERPEKRLAVKVVKKNLLH